MAEDVPSPAEKPVRRIGSYRLVEALGSGGMSSVYRAVHDESGNEVAVKVLPRSLAKNPTLLQRFLREAKSAEALQHPNIVSIYDRGVDLGRHYLVLELVAGGDLHDRVRKEGPLALDEAVNVVREVAEGLKYAASLGLIHRDVKPANLLLSPTGQVKIIDLGLALQAESEDERVTRDGTTVGTVDYMAPEQARDSRGTSERSDIYSLGCTFYYLLTGSPPYPGGDLADKLGRHCLAPIPDPRALRPEVSEALAGVVRKMMAKRPENRYANYDQLIAGLNALSRPAPSAQAAPLDALIADDDEDSTEGAAPLDALIADDDDDDDLGRAPARPTPEGRGGAASAPRAEPESAVPLADLAALDEPYAPRAARPPRPVTRTPDPGPALDAPSDEAETPASLKGRIRSSAADDAETRKWVVRLAAIGAGIVLFVIGVDQIIKASRTTTAPTEVVGETGEAPEAPLAVAVHAPEGPDTPIPAKIKAVAKPKTAAEKSSAVPMTWTEPGDPAPRLAPEPDLGGAESRFIPEWAAGPVADQVPGPLVVVRRVVDTTNPAEKPTLRQALETIGGTVEIADDGPFHEDDFRIAGDARVIRARPGFRPIVAIEPPKLETVREQPAVMVLDGKQVVVEGLDLIVDVDELPREQSALFLCRGGALTLRNCTITVVNPKAQPFAVFRTGPAAKAARVRLEQTLVRGQAATVFDFASGSAEVVVARSVLLGGPRALVTHAGNEPAADRRLHVVRSVLASKGPFLECGEPGPSGRSKPLRVQVLGSTLANVAGVGGSLIAGREGSAGPSDLVQWTGAANLYQGWRSWVATGATNSVKLANLAVARGVWAGTDETSRESAGPWPDGTLEWVVPEQLSSLASGQQAVLGRVAAPSPFLFEKSIGAFPKPRVPDWTPPPPGQANSNPAPTIAPPQVSVALPKGVVAKKAAGPAPPPSAKAAPQPAPPPALVELAFDTAVAPWNGDLGLFLRSQVGGGAKHLRVRVQGKGLQTWTPIRLPDGLTVEIIVEPAAAGVVPLSWAPLPLASADALLEVHHGNVLLSGVVIIRDATDKPKALIRVEGGHLALNRCRLIAPGVVDTDGGGLIVFQAPGSQPLAPGPVPGPFTSAVDRPVCRIVDTVLITGGDALTAEVGRGLVALTQCAIAAGHSALTLRPTQVARSRFDADLWIDHCTIAAEHNFVVLDSWPGAPPGPDRPWLVASQDNAFVAQYAAGPRENVLLRVERDALAHGTLCWQGSNDAYEVPHFTERDQAAPPLNARPDVHRQWTALWGDSHFHNVTGPGKVGVQASVRFVERLRPGDVVPADLILDPNQHRDRRALDLGASPARLGLKTGGARTGRK